MDDDHVGVMGENLHHLASLGPLPRLERVGLVLYGHGVSNREGREGLGSNEEFLLHLCISFGKNLLPQVSLQPPLQPWPVPGEYSREVVPQLPAKQDHGRKRPVMGSGVLRWSNRALANLSVSSCPLGPMFSMISLLADLTATSLLLLALG